MKYLTDIQTANNDPDKLEELYQASIQAKEEVEFRNDMQAAFETSSSNLLFSAWHSRFDHLLLPRAKRTTQWGMAIILGVITGLVLWAISGSDMLYLDTIPYLILLWAPIATIPVLVFLSLVSRRNYIYAAISGVGLVVACVYVLLVAPGMTRYQQDYLTLMAIQLPLLCWMAIGIAVLGLKSSYPNRFAFMIKSIEVMIAAGVYLIFGLAFGMITMGMFSALNVTPPDTIMRLAAACGFGLITILAVATMYDPLVTPEAQDFSQGLSKFIFTMMRLLLPLTLIVLVIYVLVIPFNFMAPYQNRDLLIVYNVMQFAIIGLLIGVTPFKLDDLSPKLQVWLRRGIIAVIILALIVSIYALSAVIYRTVTGEITLNRVTIIGWNIINIIILAALLVTQWRKSSSAWNERLQMVFSRGTTAYLVWSIFLILVLPLIFR